MKLTVREKSCLELLANGKSVIEIAARLEISPHTVTMHLHRAKMRLRALSREHAIAVALHHQMIDLTADPKSGAFNQGPALVRRPSLLPKSWRKDGDE